MQNLMTIYFIELKKILAKKAIWIMLLIGFAFIGVVQLSNVLWEKYTYGDKTISGAEFEALQRKKGEELTGLKMDDDFYENVRNELYESKEKHQDEIDSIVNTEKSSYPWVSYAADCAGYEWLLNKEQRATRSQNLDFFMEETAEEIQEAKRDNIFDTMVNDNLTEKEIDYWDKEYNSLTQPSVYSYANGYSVFFDALFIMVWLAFLVIVIGNAGVFADENLLKTDVLILSSKKGRKVACYAKLMAGVTFSVIIMLLVLALGLATPLTVWGTAGWDTPIQNVLVNCAYNMTIGQGVELTFGIAILVALVCGLFTMFLSYAFRNMVPVMAVQTGMLVLGMFSIPQKLGIISQLFELRPTSFLRNYAFVEYRLFPTPGGYINCFQMAAILYAVISVALFLITVFGYRRMQVASR